MKDILARRRQILELLRSSGALFHWHPLLIDAALDLPTIPRTIDALVGDSEFGRTMNRMSELAPSLAEALGEKPFDQLLNTANFLAQPFLATVRRKVFARFKMTVCANQLLADEIDEQLRFEYLRMADRYIPGVVGTAGEVRTFGFKAFLETQLPYKLRDIVGRCIAEIGRTEYPDEMDRFARTFSMPIPFDCGDALMRALQLSIRSHREADMLGAFLGETPALEAFAAGEQRSLSTIRRELEALFVRTAARLDEGSPTKGRPRLLHCRKALQDLLRSGDSAIGGFPPD